MIILSNTFKLAMLDRMRSSASDPILEGGLWALYTSDAEPQPDWEWPTDFIEAEFDGYARIPAPDFAEAYLDDDATAVMEAEAISFASDAPVSPEGIYGVVYLNAAGDDWFFCDTDPSAPTEIFTGGQFYQYAPRFGFKTLD